MSIESKLEVFLKQPGAYVGGDEREFIKLMREFAARGVGYGFMQQVIEWEWQARSEVGPAGAWGPEYFQKRISELEKQVIEERWQKDRAEFKLKHTMNGRGDITWCSSCRIDDRQNDWDPRHNWTPDDWRRDAREKWEKERGEKETGK